ncbi:MAG: 5-(carboxyamino)imidazole ribonucleotide synthase [Actinomycetes bacterium]
MSRPVVGMVGAGQLARMTQAAAIALDVNFRVLADGADDSAALVTPDTTVGDYRSFDDLRRFAADCDVVTFDHEHVPTEHLEALEAGGVAVRPGSRALVHAQDKRVMRERLAEFGIPTPQWSADPDALPRPYVAKAVRGGYDGRGVWFVGPGDELPATDILVEERVPIVRELAVQVARRPSGETKTWPVVETVQSDGICVEVLAPAPDLAKVVERAAADIAVRIATELDVIGVLAVELFETPDGLLVNELAMRPHNSGHWSIDGAVTSQFEQHVRAVLDWPLGDTSTLAPVSVMVNVLGGASTDLFAALPVVLADPTVRVQLYGKATRPGRKLGHVTVVGDDLGDVRARARAAAERLRGEPL